MRKRTVRKSSRDSGTDTLPKISSGLCWSGGDRLYADLEAESLQFLEVGLLQALQVLFLKKVGAEFVVLDIAPETLDPSAQIVDAPGWRASGTNPVGRGSGAER